VVYRNTYNHINGVIIKDMGYVFQYEDRAKTWATQLNKFTRNKNIWFTVEEEKLTKNKKEQE